MAVDDLTGPIPITWPTVGIAPNPCDLSSNNANWARVPQLIMALQNQLTPAGLATILNSIDPTTITTFINNLTSNTTFVTDVNTIINNWVTSNFTQVTIQQSYRYDNGPSAHQFKKTDYTAYVWNPSGATEHIVYQAVTETPTYSSLTYTAASTHAFQGKKLNNVYVLEDGTPDANFSTWASAVGVSLVKNVLWSAPTLSEDKSTNSQTYVMEAGSVDTSTIDTATAATCS